MKRILVILAVSLFTGLTAHAERPPDQNIWSFLTQLGPIGFAPGGVPLLPHSAIDGIADGNTSPFLQMVLLKNLMAKAAENAIQTGPTDADSYAGATTKFQTGLCEIKKAFQTGMLVSLLPQIKRLQANATSDQDAQGARQQMQMLVAAFTQSGGCESGDQAIDPAFAQLLSNLK